MEVIHALRNLCAETHCPRGQPEPSMHCSQGGSAASRQGTPESGQQAEDSCESTLGVFVVLLRAIEVSELILHLFCHNHVPLPGRQPDSTGAHLLVLASDPREPRDTRSQGPDILHNRYTRSFCVY